MRVAVSFTNLGPYHLARLRALARRLAQEGGTLYVIETADREARYPWQTEHADEPFTKVTLFERTELADIPNGACVAAMEEALEAIKPDAVFVAGYVRPECMEATRWCRAESRPVVLMSESGALDRRRVWWREAVKRLYVRRFDSALVGGPRHHDYLVSLGIPADRIAFGYNAIDHERVVLATDAWRARGRPNDIVPREPYFLAVSRLAPEKNLEMLLRAYRTYRTLGGDWQLVICGDGPLRAELQWQSKQLEISDTVRFEGFLQEQQLDPFYAFAAGFVHVSISEPWGLVVNEAAASGLPLLVSDTAGCVDPFVPDGAGATGTRVDPFDELNIASAMAWLSDQPRAARESMGKRARGIGAKWGPERFATGAIESLLLAEGVRPRRAARRTANARAS